MTNRYLEAVMRWPRPPDFIPAMALKEHAKRLNKWTALRALMQRDDGDVWESFVLAGGISIEDFATLLSEEAGIPRSEVGEFAREAVGKMRRR